MGSYARLSLCRTATADVRAAENYVQDTELGFKYGIAPAWIALYQEKDITIRGTREDEDYEVFLFTDLASARKSLEVREAALSAAIGEPWSRAVSAFKAYLSNRQATHVLLDATEYAEMFTDLSELQDHLVASIRTFEVPYFTGKKSLFSGKPKVSNAWNDLLAPMYSARDSALASSTGESDAQLAWFIFGSSSDGTQWTG
jgi:hypothetical protein